MPAGASASICSARRVERQDLAVHADLAHAARDQLRVLPAEVDDEDSCGVGCCFHAGLAGDGCAHSSER